MRKTAIITILCMSVLFLAGCGRTYNQDLWETQRDVNYNMIDTFTTLNTIIIDLDIKMAELERKMDALEQGQNQYHPDKDTCLKVSSIPIEMVEMNPSKYQGYDCIDKPYEEGDNDCEKCLSWKPRDD